MKVLLAFHASAWEIPEARHAVETIASLMEVPWRLGPPGAAPGEDEALVCVGPASHAPADAAAVIDVHGWPRWEAHSLVRVRVAGEPLPCPPGTPESEGGSRLLPAAWLRAAGFALAREEELQDTRRDQWECYSGAYTRLAELDLLERPMVNHMAVGLEQRIAAHAASRGRTLERRPRWRDGARFAVALSHDVDDVTLRSWRQAWRLIRQSRGARSYAFRAGITAIARALGRWPGAVDPYWAFERWMDEEERRGFRSTFFFFAPEPSRRHEYDALYSADDSLGYRGRRVSVGQLTREIVAHGHEVGLHGSYLSHTDGSELERQRRQLAEAAGVEPRGVRQHFLRFDARRTLGAQEHAGFGYDSTLGYNEALGFRAGIAAPYRPWDAARRGAHGLWELPLTAMDGALFRTLRLGPEAAAERVRRQLDAVETVGGLAVLLWHPNAADERRFPGWWSCYLSILSELARRPAWVAPAGAIAQWWEGRCRDAARGGA